MRADKRKEKRQVGSFSDYVIFKVTQLDTRFYCCMRIPVIITINGSGIFVFIRKVEYISHTIYFCVLHERLSKLWSYQSRTKCIAFLLNLMHTMIVERNKQEEIFFYCKIFAVKYPVDIHCQYLNNHIVFFAELQHMWFCCFVSSFHLSEGIGYCVNLHQVLESICGESTLLLMLIANTSQSLAHYMREYACNTCLKRIS